MGCTKIIYDLLPEKLFMGYGEEQLSRTLTFDISQMQEELPSGVPMIAYMRPRDELGYLASGVTLDGSTLTWELSAHVMQYKGIGGAQIVLVDESGEETHILKSHVMQMLIGSSIPLTGGEPPEPWETWLEQILAAAARAESAAEDAEDQADRAETAEAGAQQALIDAGSPVLYGRAQTLTDTEKQTARGNIAAASEADVSDLKSALNISFKDNVSSNLLILDEIETGYVTNSGTISDSSSYFHSGYIPVNKNDVISFYDFGGDYRTGRNSINARYIAAYDSSKTIDASSGSGSSVSSYTVPDGVAYIICTFSSSYKPLNVYISKNTTPIAYEPGYNQTYKTKSEIGRHYYKSKFDTTFYNETFELPTMSLCKNAVIAFSGFVYSFTLDSFKLSIGQGSDHFGASWIEIDKEKVYWKLHTSTTASYEFDHNLPFDTVSTGQISITILINDNTKATLKIRYGGSEYTKTLGFYGYSDQPYFVKSEVITVKYSVFSVTCKDFNAPVFVFGDSYIAVIESTAKWSHYVVEDGFGNNFCINAFPGADSSELAPAFANTLNVATPQKILWCVGMNDGSDTDASTPNSQWMTYVNNMLTVCNAKGIEPLFVTIPTVPSVNNEGKNTWIRSSGYRFADLACAVGASSSGVWETGMLSTDNVHPSEQGAKAMYVQLLADLPDLFV